MDFLGVGCGGLGADLEVDGEEMEEVKIGWAMYDRVIWDLRKKLSLWLRGMGSELVGIAFSLGMGTSLPSCWFM